MNNSFWNGKKVLITGHTGFKGSWLSLWLLLLGAEINGFALPPNDNQQLFNDLFVNNDKFKNLSGKLFSNFGDINDYENIKKYVEEVKPEIVFHLAAQPIVRKSYQEPIKTWETNLIGSLNLLNSLRNLKNKCATVLITTDKVYKNKEWVYGYRENDELGGSDPYSASKAAMEILVDSFRSSFCGKNIYQSIDLYLATARAGNVIGGGDWSEDRIIPDVVKALINKKPVEIRNPNSTRPWQHVLEPLSGYLLLAEGLFKYDDGPESLNPFASSFNFGPSNASNKTVLELVHKIFNFWDGKYKIVENNSHPNEARLLNLISDKALHQLNWKPIWGFDKTISHTINWYLKVENGESPLQCSLEDIKAFQDMMTMKKKLF